MDVILNGQEIILEKIYDRGNNEANYFKNKSLILYPKENLHLIINKLNINMFIHKDFLKIVDYPPQSEQNFGKFICIPLRGDVQLQFLGVFIINDDFKNMYTDIDIFNGKEGYLAIHAIQIQTESYNMYEI